MREARARRRVASIDEPRGESVDPAVAASYFILG
jgi:hypothetical protein